MAIDWALQGVFSAHAEVVPWGDEQPPSRAGILRARGGSSGDEVIAQLFDRYSPRTRR